MQINRYTLSLFRSLLFDSWLLRVVKGEIIYTHLSSN